MQASLVHCNLTWSTVKRFIFVSLNLLCGVCAIFYTVTIDQVDLKGKLKLLLNLLIAIQITLSIGINLSVDDKLPFVYIFILALEWVLSLCIQVLGEFVMMTVILLPLIWVTCCLLEDETDGCLQPIVQDNEEPTNVA